MFRALVLGAVAFAAAAGPVQADETYEKLVAEYLAAQERWFEEIQKFQAEAGEGQAIDMTKIPQPPVNEFAGKFRALAERHAGTPEAVQPLGWLVANSRRPGDGTWALEQLGADHAADENMLEMMRMLSFAAWSVGRQPVVGFCEKVLEVNQSAEMRAGAKFALASTLFNPAFEGPGQDTERATLLFRELVEKHPDSEFAAQAGSFIFEIENLQVGMKAPHIAGTTPTGEEISLSQFEGQVVVLDFWGFW